VRANAATAQAARLDTVFAARDADALARLFTDSFEFVEHTTGTVFDRQEAIATLDSFLKCNDGSLRHVPLATLGNSLAVCHATTSGSGAVDETLDVGAFLFEEAVLLEVDSHGLFSRGEVFPANRLGDAVLRLYERYAEIQPAGAQRDKAAAIARSVAAMTMKGGYDPDRYAVAAADDVEIVDHRRLGTSTARGKEAYVQHLRAWLGISQDMTSRDDDVLGLTSDAFLMRQTGVGTGPAGGGSYEIPYVVLRTFGVDGLMTRLEIFDADDDAKALTRFDDLTVKPSAVRRRPRPNAATAHSERFEGLEPLATLGAKLALCRHWIDGSGTAGEKIGTHEIAKVILVEVDDEGRRQRTESFAPNRLSDGIVRLYERYGEILAPGAQRDRAGAIARSVAVMFGRYDPERYLVAVGDDIEITDHRTLGTWNVRGQEAYVRHLRGWRDVAHAIDIRNDELLALNIDGLLTRETGIGTSQAGGGSYEVPYMVLRTFDADGRVTRIEMFDTEDDAKALARFDELTETKTSPRTQVPRPAVRPSVARPRVRPNAATASVARFNAAMAARDLDAVTKHVALVGMDVDQMTGTVYDGRMMLPVWRSFLETPGSLFRAEPLASLGDSLALCHVLASASGHATGKFDVGAYEMENIILVEADYQGRHRTEVFAIERLGDAIARLYERYAELQPDGPVRKRAEATARSVAALTRVYDPDRFATAIVPDVRCIDHRTLGTFAEQGAEAFVRGIRAWLEVGEGIVICDDKILGLDPDTLLVRQTATGIARESGGDYEWSYIALRVFGADGLMSHLEVFNADSEAEAIARFDELTSHSVDHRQVRRLVRQNAASEFEARLIAAGAARDIDAFAALFADATRTIHHPTGATYGKDQILASWRPGFDYDELEHRSELLATLGDSLALSRRSLSGQGAAGGELDVGAYEIETIALSEVDAQGRCIASEIFAGDRLGDAVVRMCKRYAELLPQGPERRRAEGMARSVAAATRLLDPDGYNAIVAPNIECVDHRILGSFTSRGRDAFSLDARSWRDVADDIVISVDDVLALTANGRVVKETLRGVARAGGGLYERPYIGVCVYGSDGLLTNLELFDSDREAEALARFAELTDSQPRSTRRRVRQNAATENAARVDAAVAMRDMDAFPKLFADAVESIHHPTGGTWDRVGALQIWNSQLKAQGLKHRSEPLATLGESIALCRRSVSASGAVSANMDVGPYERDDVAIVEVDADGRRCRVESFAPEHLSKAITRLYERYAAVLPQGPERQRIEGMARSVAAATGPFDPDRYSATIAPNIECVDHRILGTFTSRGRDALSRAMGSWRAVADGIAISDDDVLALTTNGRVVQETLRGVDRVGGGIYERPYIALCTYGSDGLMTHLELFDPDRKTEALTRFDELAPTPPPANTASRAMQKTERCWRERDWNGVVACFTSTHVMDDRRALFRMQVQGEQFFANERLLFDLGASEWTSELIATRGDRLALLRVQFTGEAEGSGPMTVEVLDVVEVDADGRRTALVVFDVDDTRAAYDELDRRHVRDEKGRNTAVKRPLAEVRIKNAATHIFTDVSEAWHARDWNRVIAHYSPEFRGHDRRSIAQLQLGKDDFIAFFRSLFDMASSRVEHDVFATRGDRVALARWSWHGTDETVGPSEISSLVVVEVNELGGLARLIISDDDNYDAAYAALDECYAAGEVASKGVIASWNRVLASSAAVSNRDWNAHAAQFSPDLVVYDHRLLGWETMRGPKEWVPALRSIVDLAPDVTIRLDHADLSERGALFVYQWQGTREGGRFELPKIAVTEADAAGKICRIDQYDFDQLDAARARFRETGASLGPRNAATAPVSASGSSAASSAKDPLAAFVKPNAATSAADRLQGAFVGRDSEAARAMCRPNAKFEDRRRFALVTMNLEEWMASRKLAVKNFPSLRYERQLMRTAGELVVLERELWSGEQGMGGGPFDAELIRLIEVDENGLIAAMIYFDADDLEAANREALARWVASDGIVGPIMGAVSNMSAGFNDHDAARVRASIADDFVFHDRRRTGSGRVEGAEAYIRSVTALWELAPDIQMRGHTLAHERHGAVGVACHYGTLASGGGAFENLMANVTLVENGRLTCVELFEIEDVDAALARFDELGKN
jgi:hypothetical protein